MYNKPFSYLQHFTEDSDDLWCKHCHKEFKNVFLEEGQTWRELYFVSDPAYDSHTRHAYVYVTILE